MHRKGNRHIYFTFKDVDETYMRSVTKMHKLTDMHMIFKMEQSHSKTLLKTSKHGSRNFHGLALKFLENVCCVWRDLPQDIGTVLVQILEYVLGHIPRQTPGRAQSCVIWEPPIGRNVYHVYT